MPYYTMQLNESAALLGIDAVVVLQHISCGCIVCLNEAMTASVAVTFMLV